MARMRQEPKARIETVKVGDTVEFVLTTADLKLTGTVMGINETEFLGFRTFDAWSDGFGGLLVRLPVLPTSFAPGKWKLLYRPDTLVEARDRMLKARVKCEQAAIQQEAEALEQANQESQQPRKGD
jgi:hypothetical protein